MKPCNPDKNLRRSLLKKIRRGREIPEPAIMVRDIGFRVEVQRAPTLNSDLNIQVLLEGIYIVP